MEKTEQGRKESYLLKPGEVGFTDEMIELAMKKGVVLSMEVVLLMILSVAVLTILVIFLNERTHFFSEAIDSFRSKSNVDDIVTSCNSWATTESLYSYCCEEKVVRLGKGKQDVRVTCGDLVDEDFISNRIEVLDCGEIVCAS